MKKAAIALAILPLLSACGTVQQAGAWVADRTEGTIDTLIELNDNAVRVGLKELCQGMRLEVYRRYINTPEKQEAHNALCTPAPVKVAPIQ